ncbi:MAG: spore germination protein GerW family protein [Tepidiformaceae bacterium]
MDNELSRVMREAQQAAGGRASGLIEGLAERLGLHARASAVFGEPVVQGALTVIPVAKVRYGFGGGSGASKNSEDQPGPTEGEGGGGGVIASPLGFIELRDGVAEFKPIGDPASAVPVILASALAAWVVLRGLRRLVR